MNLTQNDKLNQVTADTLIVGVDIGSQIHFARAFDWRCFEFTKRVFRFGNTKVGFLSFLRWLEEIQKKTGKTRTPDGTRSTARILLFFACPMTRPEKLSVSWKVKAR